MSARPIALRADVQRLVDEGFEVEIRQGHLLVHSVPHVTPNRTVELGTLVSAFAENGKPADHTVWFCGETPCNGAGQPLNLVIIESQRQVLFDDFVITHRFSNKKTDVPDFPADYFVKMEHYVDVLGAFARTIDPNADARTGKAFRSREERPIFHYPDPGASRAGIYAITQKLELQRVAIVGLGGTGSYVLDQVAKTRVHEIHLYDGDDFKRGNAFRAPGAANLDTLERRPKKVQYFYQLYSAMHLGIVPHPYHVGAGNLEELRNSSFVFICVDDGPSRGLIARFLVAAGVPFIDVGMSLEKGPTGLTLLGSCRVTLATPSKNDHLGVRLPVADDREEALYRNIQVADLNALNAVLAIILWKQHFTFYENYDKPHNLSYAVALHSLARDDKAQG